MKKLKVLFDYSPICRGNKTGIPVFLEGLYSELALIESIELERTRCISDHISTKYWWLYRLVEKYFYHNIYIPIKLCWGGYDIYIESQYMFIPLIKPRNTTIVTFIYDIGLILFDSIQTEQHTDNWREKLPISIKNSDVIITISQSSLQDIRLYLESIDELRKPLEYIYANANVDINSGNTFEASKVLHDFGIKGDFILFLGTLEPRKNPLRLVEAFKQFKEVTGDATKLVFAGRKGWLFGDVFKYIEANDLQEEIIFTGYVSEAEKNCLLSNSQAFLFLSLYEGFGIPPLEALRLGVPCLVSDIKVFHELFEDSVYFVDPHDCSAIAYMIEKIMINPPTIDPGIFEKFSWKGSAMGLAKIIHKHHNT